MDVESETVEQRTTDTTRGADMDERKDDGTLDPRTLQDESSTHWPITSLPVLTTGQGESLTEARESVRAELKESDEMEVYSSSDDTVNNDDEDFGAHISRMPSGHYALDDSADKTGDIDVNNTLVSGGHFSGGYYVLDDVADNTEDNDVNNTRVSGGQFSGGYFSGGHFSGGRYILGDNADNTEDLGADIAGDPGARYALDDIGLPQCFHTEDIAAINTTDYISVTRLAISSEDIENSPSNAVAPQNFTIAKNNENPAQARQMISVSPELDIDHTEEPDLAEEFEETPPDSNSTGTGTEGSKESDEMSDNTEVPTNSVASFNQNNVDIKPFNFLGCPDKVRQRILHHVLRNKNPIRPYYKFGALELPAHMATRENYPTVVAAFAGNAELVDQASTILYGENVFHLRDAKVALWWLKRIGRANVSRLRHLHVALDEGVADHFGTRKEAVWRKAFAILHDRQRLSSLSVGFRGWTTETGAEDGLNGEDVRVWGPRYAVLMMLLSWRGLHDVEMNWGAFVTSEDAEVLVNALVMEQGETSEEA